MASIETDRLAASPNTSRRNDWLLAAALVVVVFLVYQPAWQGGLVWDDNAHITSPELRSWHGLYRIWFDVGATLQYYPLLHSVFWVEHKLWGDATLGYHLVNIGFHALAALMVALILRRLAIPGAYLAAAIFALHPVHVESVAWISELKNTLSAVFYLSALIVYLRFDQSRKMPTYLGALGLFVLGLLSKTVIATLPGALLVIFWWQRGRLSWRRDVLPLVPFFLLGAAGGMITAWWELKINACVGPEFTFTFVERLLIAGRATWFHAWKLFWPAKLLFIYPRWQIDSGAWWQYLFPLGAVAVLAVCWTIRRRTRAPLAAILYFGGTLVPVLGFFNLYTFRYSLVANHYQYLASLGIIVLASAGAATLLNHRGLWHRPAGYALCLALLATLAMLTWRQSRMYTDIETLYRTTIAENPDCWMSHNNLGTVLTDRGRTDEAIAEFRKSLEINPNNAMAYGNLGILLAGRGQFDEAIARYQQALEIAPADADVHNNLGSALAYRGQIDDAMVHFRKAVAIKPDSAEAQFNLGMALDRQNQVVDAVAHWREAIRLQPRHTPIAQRLAWALATCPDASIRNGAEAVELAQRAAKLSGGREPAILDTLAAAYAESGRFPEAVETAQRALDLARGQNNKALVDAIRARMKLYRAGSPYRETRQSTAPRPVRP
jgi:protein O-mannosyl-transferase